MTQLQVEKLDKKALRATADKLGVEWDKRTDTEETLRKKVRKAAKLIGEEGSESEAADGTAFDLSKRSPTTTIIDPKTRKEVKVPVACYGWYFNPKPEKGKVDCKADCPHWKSCKPLSEKSAAAIEALEEEEAAESEADAVTEEDATQIKTAAKAKEKSSKKEKGESIVKESKRKNALDEDSELTVAYDEDWTLSVEDDDFRKFYKRLLKKYPEKSTVKVSQVIDVFCATLGLDDRDAVLTEMIPEMISNGDFTRA